MKFGVIARCESRGLGHQSLDVCENLSPDRVLLIDPGKDSRFVSHWDWYDRWDTTVARWKNGRLNESTARRFLDGLDVAYSAETPYDERFPQWAADAGCGLVVHVNPELLNQRDAEAPVTWWAPTPWRLEYLPPSTRVVPMPAPTPPFTHAPGPRLRFLHVAGWPAVADRNGTDLFAAAANLMTIDADLIIRGQHPDIRQYATDRVRVEVDVSDRWQLYRDADVLVMPRRYGGLCLPALEALSIGLPVVMSDCSPNEVWPGPRVPTHDPSRVHTRAGPIPLHDVNPFALADLLDSFDYETARREAVSWAAANNWAALEPLWLDELGRACR